ncbi:ankyrin repeat domain-containing protein [Crassaminicella profunda]|uniref:ankyrin repeat domain-containing protein n=1 Tax=Crassaminicella profunda TaxID=1286698 RepID=UPI001CA5FA9F|nr:ankyrin repeat domain-containing protein [Crassaminicella profunda]QZY54529.1 ankyrin repeat domain-containing protein [Crassaminicella profunda]
MDFIILILIILAFVQGFLVSRKWSKIAYKEDLAKVNELMGYIDRREFDLTDDEGKNPLMIACSSHFFKNKGNEFTYNDVVKNAISKGININQKCLKEGKTALVYAIKNNHGDETVKLLLRAGADVNIVDDHGRTALFDAIKYGKYSMIKDQVSNVNHKNNYGITPLMIAAFNMEFDVIDDLINRGANAKLTNISGENSFDVAVKNMKKHIRIAIESENLDEGGKPRNITTSQDVLDAQKHNYKVREMVRKLECIVNDIEYRPKEFKRPFLNTRKAN